VRVRVPSRHEGDVNQMRCLSEAEEGGKEVARSGACQCVVAGRWQARVRSGEAVVSRRSQTRGTAQCAEEEGYRVVARCVRRKCRQCKQCGVRARSQ